MNPMIYRGNRAGKKYLSLGGTPARIRMPHVKNLQIYQLVKCTSGGKEFHHSIAALWIKSGRSMPLLRWTSAAKEACIAVLARRLDRGMQLGFRYRAFSSEGPEWLAPSQERANAHQIHQTEDIQDKHAAEGVAQQQGRSTAIMSGPTTLSKPRPMMAGKSG